MGDLISLLDARTLEDCKPRGDEAAHHVADLYGCARATWARFKGLTAPVDAATARKFVDGAASRGAATAPMTSPPRSSTAMIFRQVKDAPLIPPVTSRATAADVPAGGAFPRANSRPARRVVVTRGGGRAAGVVPERRNEVSAPVESASPRRARRRAVVRCARRTS